MKITVHIALGTTGGMTVEVKDFDEVKKVLAFAKEQAGFNPIAAPATQEVPAIGIAQAIEEAHQETKQPSTSPKLELVKPTPAAPVAPVVPTVEEAIDVATKLAQSGSGGMVKIRDLLAAAGAARVGEIVPEKRAAFIEAANKEIAATTK